jgi:hypothetical protein
MDAKLRPGPQLIGYEAASDSLATCLPGPSRCRSAYRYPAVKGRPQPGRRATGSALMGAHSGRLWGRLGVCWSPVGEHSSALDAEESFVKTVPLPAVVGG